MSPSLLSFSIATSKEAWVVDVWVVSRWGKALETLFLKITPDWEFEVVSFLKRIQERQLRNGEDKLVWRESKDGKFTVEAFYSLDGTRRRIGLLGAGGLIFLVSSTWEAECGKILTLDRLKRGGSQDEP